MRSVAIAECLCDKLWPLRLTKPSPPFITAIARGVIASASHTGAKALRHRFLSPRTLGVRRTSTVSLD